MNRTIESLLAIVLTLAALPVAATTAEPAPDLPTDLEIELALSALPPHLRDGATVYTLGDDGRFQIARKGDNGFHTLVSRNDPNAIHGRWPLSDYPDDILVPIAFDAAGARSQMKVLFDMANLRASGLPAEEMRAEISRRFEDGVYSAPDRVGISYMLAPVFRTYFDPESSDQIMTMNVPHYMFYAPGVTNEQIGGKFQSQYPFVLNRSAGPHGYIILTAGQAETAEINAQQATLIRKLCEVREIYCLAPAES